MYAGSLDDPPVKGEKRRILATPYPVLYSDGYLLYPRGKSLFAQRFDPGTLVVNGDPLPIAELDSSRDSISVSANGILSTAPKAADSKVLSIVSRDGTLIQRVGTPGAFSAARLSIPTPRSTT